MTELATIACGPGGEDTLCAAQHEDGTVELARTRKSGRVERWPVEASDTLRVRGEALTLVSRCGASSAIAPASGDLAAFAEAVAIAAGCAVSVDKRNV